MTFRCPDKYRVQMFPGAPMGDQQNGCFVIPLKHGQTVRVPASIECIHDALERSGSIKLREFFQ